MNDSVVQPRRVVGLYNSGYYFKDFLEEVEQEIQQKAFRVQAGIDTFSKAEQLAYMVLEQNGYFSVEPTIYCGDEPNA